MRTLIFDIETDGLYMDVSKVHCLEIMELETHKRWHCTDHSGYTSIREGLELLRTADKLVGHNCIAFDIPVLQKLYPDWNLQDDKDIFDTLVVSRLIYTRLGEQDVTRKNVPKGLKGKHSLKAWGYRLHEFKGDYCEEENAWENWSPEMQDYCEQDVTVTAKLYEYLWRQGYSMEAITLEQKFAKILFYQWRNGFRFDIKAAEELRDKLRVEDAKAIRKIKDIARNQELNPNARQQIAKVLLSQGWTPEQFTPTGQPKVDEGALKHIDSPFARAVLRHMTLLKRLGQLSDGPSAWLKMVNRKIKVIEYPSLADDKNYSVSNSIISNWTNHGYIHGEVISCGCVTGRCAHHSPNVAQVPTEPEYRSLFSPPEGFVEVGVDAKALEFRMLAHYLARYDEGKTTDVVLHSDIHTENQKAAGLATRDQAKTFIYAYMYGAGNAKLGRITHPDASQEEQARVGEQLRRRFQRNYPALAQLTQQVQSTARERGYLLGLDKRKILVRAEYSALNALLQCAGAVAVKQATIILHDDMAAAGYVYGRDWVQLAHIHDEYQLGCRPEIAEEVARIGVEAIRKAGEHFHLRCPLDGEAKVGNNWAETH